LPPKKRRQHEISIFGATTSAPTKHRNRMGTRVSSSRSAVPPVMLFTASVKKGDFRRLYEILELL
jgi:hypothetical protein